MDCLSTCFFFYLLKDLAESFESLFLPANTVPQFLHGGQGYVQS